MHSGVAWDWFSTVANDSLFFCRFTQIGLLRLLATSSIMGEDVLTIGEGWAVYDRWLDDSRIGIRQESFETESAFRSATQPFARLYSPKALGDCYLLAVSRTTSTTLVTLDRGLESAGRKAKQPVLLLE
jgi:hypothetical protein